MKIVVNNRQKIVQPNTRRLEKLISHFMKYVCHLDKQTVWNEISIVLVDDAEIIEINKHFLNRSYPTDVICFYYPQERGIYAGADAEIIVNVQRALVEGSKHNGASIELALYIAHGCDHLTGEDDRTDRGQRRMHQRELRWLRKARKSELLSSLFRENQPEDLNTVQGAD